jgi:hypothetical protein
MSRILMQLLVRNTRSGGRLYGIQSDLADGLLVAGGAGPEAGMLCPTDMIHGAPCGQEGLVLPRP